MLVREAGAHPPADKAETPRHSGRGGAVGAVDAFKSVKEKSYSLKFKCGAPL